MNPLLIIIGDRIWIVWEFCQQILIERLLFCDVLDEVWYHLVVLVLPRFFAQPFSFTCLSTADAPVIVEVLLNLLHLFTGCILGILLHAGINGCINLQTAGIEIVTFFLTPVFQVIGYGFAEVLSLSVIVLLYLEVEFDRKLFQFFILSTRQVAMSQHVI